MRESFTPLQYVDCERDSQTGEENNPTGTMTESKPPNTSDPSLK